MPKTAKMIDGGDEIAQGCTSTESFAVTRKREGGIMQPVETSPYNGPADLAGLDGLDGGGRVDMVSLADLLRNSFVYPPHSIIQGVKLATPGIEHGVSGGLRFHSQFRDRERCPARGDDGVDWIETYHRLLCEAITDSCKDIRSPWLLQSGGKDSTTLAIAAADARPDTTCITYLGGQEENEVASARANAKAVGLRHETLVCDPGRAYDRYVALVWKLPLLTADFAMMSYVDVATEIAANGGDGVIDGLGSDWYFGMYMHRRNRILAAISRDIRLPFPLCELPLIERSFRLCYLLSSLEMNPVERSFPGSRFSDAEVDELFGREVSHLSRARLATFQPELASADSLHEWWCMVSSIAGEGAALAKGVYTLHALSMRAAYPFCDRRLRNWVHKEVPQDLLLDLVTHRNKVLVRRHIATRFGELPYVTRKGSFRFDLCSLARARFDQVHAYALRAREELPGAVDWLERNRHRLSNKFYASKFYLLAVALPWITARGEDARDIS